MNWPSVIDGSVLTGIAIGIIAIIRGWTILSRDLAALTKSFEACQRERTACRTEMREHHENRFVHIDPERDAKAMQHLLEKIEQSHAQMERNHAEFKERMGRIEAVLLKLNGGVK